jgi:DNA (cytosine-5)-methyltransferase 1
MNSLNKNMNSLNKKELFEICEKLGLKKYKSKNKKELCFLIELENKKLYNETDHETDHEIEDETEDEIEDETEDEIKHKIKFIDLFCGIGGFHQALNNIGGECVFACDIDDKCREIYEKNYNIKPEGDITKVNIEKIPKFNILCAGFPCQPFSKAGLQKGFEDKRGNLFFNICDIIKIHNPEYLLLENVRNLASHDDGNTWKIIYENIDSLGYYTYLKPIILNVLHFNIPQNRERVIIMCKRKDLGELKPLPTIPKNPKLKLTKFIKDYLYNDDNLNKKYQLTQKMKDVKEVWNNLIVLLKNNNILFPKFPIWTEWWDKNIKKLTGVEVKFYKKYKNWIDKNQLFYKDNENILNKWLKESRKCSNWIGAVRKLEWQAGDLGKYDSLDTLLWSARGSGIRVKNIDYIPTLVAMSMIPIYGPENRKLNPRELLRLQSFSDTFIYDQKTIFKQIGNAVNVKMIQNSINFLIFNKPLFEV